MRIGQSYRVQSEPACPVCLAVLDGVTAMGHDERPSAGYLTVCAYCRSLLVFGEDMSLRLIEPEELQSLERNEPRTYAFLRRVQESAAAVVGDRPAPRYADSVTGVSSAPKETKPT